MFSYYLDLFNKLPFDAGISLGLGLFFMLVSLFIVNKQFSRALLFLLLSVFLIGVAFGLITPYLHPWDEVIHAVVAKNMAETPLIPRLLPETPISYDYKIWIENHIWLHKPPLTFWQIAFLFKLFGPSVFVTRLTSIILFTGTVFLAFKIGTLLKDKKTGYYAALLLGSLNYVYMLISGHHTAEHVDISFQFYITASCFAWLKYATTEKRYWILIMGLLSGGAILTKWLVGLLVYAGVGLTILFNRKYRLDAKTWKGLGLSIGVTLITFLPWQIYTAIKFPEEFWHETGFSSLHFHEVIEEHGGDIFFYWDNLKDIYGVGFFGQLLLLFSILFSVRTIKRQHALFVISTILIPYIFFTMASTKMNSFLIIVKPLVCILIVALILNFKKNLPYVSFNYKNQVFALLVFIFSLLLLRPRQIQRDFLLDTPTNRAISEKRIELHEYVKSYVFPENENNILFNMNYLPNFSTNWMFHHNVIAYQRNLTDEEIKFLLNNNYSLYTFVENSLQPIIKP